jgi:hypothetical protein
MRGLRIRLQFDAGALQRAQRVLLGLLHGLFRAHLLRNDRLDRDVKLAVDRPGDLAPNAAPPLSHRLRRADPVIDYA